MKEIGAEVSIVPSESQEQVVGLLLPLGPHESLPSTTEGAADPERLWVDNKGKQLYELVPAEQIAERLIGHRRKSKDELDDEHAEEFGIPVDETVVSAPERLGWFQRNARQALKIAAIPVAALTALVAIGSKMETAEANSATPVQPGADVTVGGLTPNHIQVLGLASIGTAASWSAVYGDVYNGTAVTTPSGPGNIAINQAFIKSTNGGDVKIKAGVAPQDEILDLSMSFPEGPNVEFKQSPERTADFRTPGGVYIARQVLKVSYGVERANQAVTASIAIDGPKGNGFIGAYGCANGWDGAANVSYNGNGAHAGTTIVKLDANGEMCMFANTNAYGLIVDTYGFFKGVVANQLHNGVRILDTRLTQKPLIKGSEEYYSFGKEYGNHIFVGAISNDRTSGAGWIAAYPRSSGYQGTANITPDGKTPSTGLVFGYLDENGEMAYVLGGGGSATRITSDVILDKFGLINPADLGIDISQGLQRPRRIYDSRTATPPPPPTTPPTTSPPTSGVNFEIISNTGYPVTKENFSVSCTSRYEKDAYTGKIGLIRRFIMRVTGLDRISSPTDWNNSTLMTSSLKEDNGANVITYSGHSDMSGVAQTEDYESYVDRPVPADGGDEVHGVITVSFNDQSNVAPKNSGTVTARVDISQCAA